MEMKSVYENGTPKISVIVPVYNGEVHLRQCIESLVNQTMKDIELIFVDDGSTDRSAEIIREYQKTDSRIRLICQKNQYAGAARNNGFSCAGGKYVIFLDSDDFFAPRMLECCYKRAEKMQAQVVMFRFDCFDEEKKERFWARGKLNKYAGKAISSDDLGEKVFSVTYPAPWDKFVLREYLIENHIAFPTARKCNDVCWSWMTIACADRLTYIDRTFLHYRVNNNSSLQGNQNRGMEYYLVAAAAVKKELADRGLLEKEHINEAYKNEAHGMVANPLYSITDKEMLHTYYLKAKEYLIPSIFESGEEIKEGSAAREIYESDSFEDFLFRLLQYMRKNSVSTRRMEYIIGHMVLTPIRKILKYVHL